MADNQPLLDEEVGQADAETNSEPGRISSKERQEQEARSRFRQWAEQRAAQREELLRQNPANGKVACRRLKDILDAAEVEAAAPASEEENKEEGDNSGSRGSQLSLEQAAEAFANVKDMRAQGVDVDCLAEVGRLLLHVLTKSHRPTIWAEFEHETPVQEMQFSPDGAYLATRSDQFVRIFDISTQKEILKLEYKARLFAMHRKCLALGRDNCDYNEVLIFEIGSSNVVSKLVCNDICTCISFSPDGAYLAVGIYQSYAQVFEISSGSEVTKIEDAYYVRNVSFSPNGSRLATVGSDNCVLRIFEMSGGNEISKVEHGSWVRSFDFSPDGAYLATGSVDNFARILEISSGNEICKIEHDTCKVRFIFDGAYLAASGASTLVIEVSSGDVLLEFDTSSDDCCLSPDSFFYLAFKDRDAKFANIIEVDSVNVLHRMKHEEIAWSARFGPSRAPPANSNDTNIPRVFESGSGNEATIEHEYEVGSVHFSPDGARLATVALTTARMFEVSSGMEVSQIETSVFCESFSPDWAYLAFFSFDLDDLDMETNRYNNSSVRILETSSGNEVMMIEYGEREVTGISFSPDGARLAIGSDKCACVIEISTGREVTNIQLEDRVNGVSFSPDGARFAAGSDDKCARIIEVNSGNELLRLQHTNPVTSFRFSPDGELLATGCEDTFARIVDSTTGKELHKLQHKAWVLKVLFSPDGERLATCSDDFFAHVFEINSGDELFKLRHEGTVASLDFSPDGVHLATSSSRTPACRLGASLVFNVCSSFEHLARCAKDKGVLPRLQGKETSAPDVAPLKRCWLGTGGSMLHFGLYLLAASEVRADFRQKVSREIGHDRLGNVVRHMLERLFEQPGGVQVALARDALGLNLFDLAMLLPDEKEEHMIQKVNIMAALLSQHLLSWMQANPADWRASTSIAPLLSYLIRTGRGAVLDGSVSFSLFLDAACVAMDPESLGLGLLGLPRPPAVVGRSLDLLVVPSIEPFVRTYEDLGLPTDGANVPLQVEVLLLPNFAEDRSLFAALAARHQPDEDGLFSCKAVRALVHLHWEVWQWLFYVQFGLFVILLTGFVMSSCSAVAPVTAKNCMIGVAMLLTAWEIMELIGKKVLVRHAFKDHASVTMIDGWTLLGLLLPALAVASSGAYDAPDSHTQVVSQLCDSKLCEAFARGIRPLTAVLMWVYIYHYLAAFEVFSFYVRMTVQCFVDMVPFIVIFFVLLSGFVQALHLTSHSSGDGIWDAWLTTFRLGIFGDGPDDFEEDGYAYAWFLVFTICVPIVFLNILIAIVGDTYAKVGQNSVAAFTKARAGMVHELQGAFWLCPRRPKPGKYLLIFTKHRGGAKSDLEVQISEVKQEVAGGQKRMQTMEEELGKLSAKINDTSDKLNSKIDNASEKLNSKIDDASEKLNDASEKLSRILDYLDKTPAPKTRS